MGSFVSHQYSTPSHSQSHHPRPKSSQAKLTEGQMLQQINQGLDDFARREKQRLASFAQGAPDSGLQEALAEKECQVEALTGQNASLKALVEEQSNAHLQEIAKQKTF